MPDAIEVLTADWPADAGPIAAIRRTVFVEEQGVPAELEWDGRDGDCTHALALVNREPVGTGRLMPTGKVGRLAVLATSRRHGIGSLLLRHLVEVARGRGLREVYLHAQVYAMPFYVAHGFVAEGADFFEAGIAHRRMRLALAQDPASADQRAAPADARAAEPPVQRG